MNYFSRTAAVALVAAALAVSAEAGQVRLQIKDGLVTLQATDATPREILAEWARIGQTRIVNGDRAAGAPLTIELNGVPERQALDIILRAAPGYMAAPRPVALANASVYDRILVMPGARTAAAAAASAPNTPSQPPQRYPGMQGGYPMGNMQPQPGAMVDDQDEPVVQPQPQPGPTPMMPGAASQPGMPTQSNFPNQPAPYANPYGAGATPSSPGTTGGATTATRPGMPTAPVKPGGGPGGPGGDGGNE